MRSILLPTPVTLIVQNQSLMVQLPDLVLEAWTLSPLFNVNLKTIEMGARVRAAFRAALRDGVKRVLLEEEDWALLAKVVREEHEVRPQVAIPLFEVAPAFFTNVTQAARVDNE